MSLSGQKATLSLERAMSLYKLAMRSLYFGLSGLMALVGLSMAFVELNFDTKTADAIDNLSIPILVVLILLGVNSYLSIWACWKTSRAEDWPSSIVVGGFLGFVQPWAIVAEYSIYLFATYVIAGVFETFRDHWHILVPAMLIITIAVWRTSRSQGSPSATHL